MILYRFNYINFIFYTLLIQNKNHSFASLQEVIYDHRWNIEFFVTDFVIKYKIKYSNYRFSVK